MSSDLHDRAYGHVGMRANRPNEITPEERRRAVRHVASQAEDAGDCAALLAALGLTAAEGLAEENHRD